MQAIQRMSGCATSASSPIASAGPSSGPISPPRSPLSRCTGRREASREGAGTVRTPDRIRPGRASRGRLIPAEDRGTSEETVAGVHAVSYLF